jgi:hypothetical protein
MAAWKRGSRRMQVLLWLSVLLALLLLAAIVWPERF